MLLKADEAGSINYCVSGISLLSCYSVSEKGILKG